MPVVVDATVERQKKGIRSTLNVFPAYIFVPNRLLLEANTFGYYLFIAFDEEKTVTFARAIKSIYYARSKFKLLLLASHLNECCASNKFVDAFRNIHLFQSAITE